MTFDELIAQIERLQAKARETSDLAERRAIRATIALLMPRARRLAFAPILGKA